MQFEVGIFYFFFEKMEKGNNLMNEMPDDIRKFLIFKEQWGRTQLHIDTCSFRGIPELKGCCFFNTWDDAGLPVNNTGFHSSERPISRKIARIFPKMVSTDFAANVFLQQQPLSSGIPRKEQVSICNCVRPHC
jgi:hypothetical protein